MSHEETNKIKYIIALVADFAAKFSIGEKQVFDYLQRFKWMDYYLSFTMFCIPRRLRSSLILYQQYAIEKAEN